ncbi:MAG: hypothetical protein HY664_03940 [Chloroflexi bacterium]|nr:hypothetical protein [Chloroflexota bacterium]
MGEAIFGLVGVILGAVLASMFELWRRVLDGQAAARVIRMETADNRYRIELVLNKNFHWENLKTSAWETYRLIVAPFLEELEFHNLNRSYSLDQIPRMLSADEKNARMQQISFPTSKTRKQLEDWLEQTRGLGKRLRRIEATNPWRLVVTLLTSRKVATEEEIRKEFRLEENEQKTDEVPQP